MRDRLIARGLLLFIQLRLLLSLSIMRNSNMRTAIKAIMYTLKIDMFLMWLRLMWRAGGVGGGVHKIYDELLVSV